MKRLTDTENINIIGKKGGLTMAYHETPKTTKTIKMEDELIEKITTMGKKAERDFSSQVRYMLKEYIKIKEEQ